MPFDNDKYRTCDPLRGRKNGKAECRIGTSERLDAMMADKKHGLCPAVETKCMSRGTLGYWQARV